jgi:hypothetical protein
MVLVGSSVAYLVLIKILSTLMANREAFVCREIMILYNLVQIALCGYMTIGITTLLMTEAPVWEPIEGACVHFSFMWGWWASVAL